MTPRSVAEYVDILRPRYRGASRAEKAAMLSEAERVTGYHRKSLIRRLRPPVERARRPVGRPRRYGPEIVPPLVRLWEAADRSCGKRLVPFLSELLDALERHGEIHLSPEARRDLLSLSAATADRLLAEHRHRSLQRPYAHHPAASPLLAAIPIRTFGEWDDATPGSAQADLVAHCGEYTGGAYLGTLVAVDVVLGWTELRAVSRVSAKRVQGAVHHVRARWPIPIHAFHSDNGSEFLNAGLHRYCRDNNIRSTRGRAYKKNDQAWVEQRNWTAVRRVIGYDRYSSKAALEALNALYPPLSLYLNFFQPLRKLLEKHRHGARVVKRYDEPRTPYQRLLRDLRCR
ncbi:MAG: integrase catalytic domain-containing protein [Gemmatimonadota bacterium]